VKTIIVTGIPGTGKTSLAKKLAKKLHFSYIDVNAILRKGSIWYGYDRKRKTKIIDTRELNFALIKAINSNKEQGIIVDSHLSHYLPKRHVDICVVTKCDLKELEKRLMKREYSKSKVRENLDAEIFDVCLDEAKLHGHKILVVNTTKSISINDVSRKIGDLIDI
jgi:adenylate kinase